MAAPSIIGVVLDLPGGYYCGGIFAGVQRLGWLNQTAVLWARPARYAGDAQGQVRTLEAIGIYRCRGPAPPLLGSHYPIRAFPPAEWFTPSSLADGAPVMTLLQIRLTPHPGSLLALCASIDGNVEILDTRMNAWGAFNIHFPTFIEAIAGICQACGEQKRLQCIYESQTRLPVGIHMDEKRLRQVLLNMLGNAAPFCA